jgi:hypothetical protein
MTLALERWAKEAIANEKLGIFDPVASRGIIGDLEAMKLLQRLTWAERQRQINESGIATMMPEGTYGGLLAYPNAQTVTTTTLSGTVNLWSNLVYSPIPANSVLAPQAYRVAVVAKITTGLTPANIGFNPLINSTGTWTTGGTAVSGGSTLGATPNVALTASITNAFYTIIGDLTFRTAGTGATAVFMAHYVSTQATASGLAGPAVIGAGHNLMFGGTGVTVDAQTTGQSFQLGAVHTVTTITHNVEQIHLMDWN